MDYPDRTGEMLIDPEALNRMLDAPGIRVVDCRFNLMEPEAGQQAFLESHVPGAVYAHLDNDLAGPVNWTTGRHPLPDAETLMSRLGAWGLTEGCTVVVYDDAGGAIAARLWWLLKWLGHSRVQLLDGGWQAWKEAELPVETGQVTPMPKRYDGEPGQRPVMPLKAVVQGSESGDLRLLDARAAPRFRGEMEPIDPVAGHVPGAANVPFDENLDEDGCFKPAQELRALYEPLVGDGPTPAAMCGSGVTACHTLFALELAGYEPGPLYVGSWSEWVRDPQRPVAGSDAA